jgi:hypothetical protein
LEDGKDPFTGEVISVQEQFQLRSKTDCIVVYCREKDGAYVPRFVRGPRMCAAGVAPGHALLCWGGWPTACGMPCACFRFMPQPNEYVAEFVWTHPETHQPGAFKFTYISTASQSLKLLTKKVQKHDDSYDVELMLFFKVRSPPLPSSAAPSRAMPILSHRLSRPAVARVI